MKTVKPFKGTATGLKIIAGPTVLLRLWLSGFDFSKVGQFISKGSQLKSGDFGEIDSVRYLREGSKVVLTSVSGHQDRKKAEQLLKKLIVLLSKKSASDISTL